MTGNMRVIHGTVLVTRTRIILCKRNRTELRKRKTKEERGRTEGNVGLVYYGRYVLSYHIKCPTLKTGSKDGSACTKNEKKINKLRSVR